MFRRRRAAVLLVVAGIAALGVLAALLAGAGRAAAPAGSPGGGPLTAAGRPVGASPRPVAANVWVVRPGDTLWSIVVDSGVSGDPRPVVDRLEAQLGGKPLQPGERLILP